MSTRTKGRVLRAKEVATRLGVSAETARKLLLVPEVGAFQLWDGGARLIHEGDLDAYIQRRKVTAGAKA